MVAGFYEFAFPREHSPRANYLCRIDHASSYFVGFHSRASHCASAIYSGVILVATRSRYLIDWPVCPRLRHIVQGSERARNADRGRCSRPARLNLRPPKTAENMRDVGRADPKTPGLNSRPYWPGGRRLTRGGVASRSVAACRLSAAS
jgi:hypothetical protein